MLHVSFADTLSTATSAGYFIVERRKSGASQFLYYSRFVFHSLNSESPSYGRKTNHSSDDSYGPPLEHISQATFFRLLVNESDLEVSEQGHHRGYRLFFCQ